MVARLSSEGVNFFSSTTRPQAPQVLPACRPRDHQAKKTPDPAEAIRKKIARYRSFADNLLDAWRRSQADKEVRVVQTTGPAGDREAAKEKSSLRTETQAGNASFMARAMEAENRIEVLEQRLAALEQTGRGGGGPPASLASLTDDDLGNLTPDDLDNFDDDQLYVIECRLRAKDERQGVKFDEPPLTDEELRGMSDQQLTALEVRLQAEIDALDGKPPARESAGPAPGDIQRYERDECRAEFHKPGSCESGIADADSG